MVAFNIILWNNAGVLHSSLVKEVSGVGLLQKGITDVFLIAENLVDGAGVPFGFACTGKNAIRFKACCNLKAKVRRNATIDWTVKESVRAKLMVIVRRILKKYGYPPDMQESAIQTVLTQATNLAGEWTK